MKKQWRENQKNTADETEHGLPTDAWIVCDGLVKIYQSDQLKVMALQGLDLEIKRGEMVAIIGKSGSGKSTLLNMIGGLERPTAGRLYVGGRDLSGFQEKEMVQYRKNTVGFVWQKSARNLFWYMTAVENVEAPMYFASGNKRERRRRALDLLEEVGMLEHADKFPAQLSGGEQQRVAIAAALANQPSVLLADEPTGAVDSKTADKIFRLFQKLNQDLGLTILIVTHDMATADKAGRTIMISDGKISTEKIRKTEYQGAAWGEEALAGASHEEYAVLDKARRVQLSEEALEQAGINSNRVKIDVTDGRIVITGE